MAHNVRALAIPTQYSTYLQTWTDCDIKEELPTHPHTGASVYINTISYLTQANTNGTHSSFTHHIFHTFITSLIHPQLSISFNSGGGSSCASVASKREKKIKQPPVCFLWWRQLIPLFQTFRKVLWISSSSPASSWARPCTPLCSSPGLSVGAATHTISMRQSQSHDHLTERWLKISSWQILLLAW